jgi:hypothetical protein
VEHRSSHGWRPFWCPVWLSTSTQPRPARLREPGGDVTATVH